MFLIDWDTINIFKVMFCMRFNIVLKWVNQNRWFFFLFKEALNQFSSTVDFILCAENCTMHTVNKYKSFDVGHMFVDANALFQHIKKHQHSGNVSLPWPENTTFTVC